MIVLAGLLAGLLMAATHLAPRLAPLQLLALGGWFAAVTTLHPHWTAAAAGGGLLGALPAVSLAISLRLPLAMSLPVVALLAAAYAGAAAAGALLAGRAGLTGLLACAGLMALADQLQMRLMPFFGTAQSLVRTWSSWPGLIQLTAWTGLSGLMLAEASLAAAAAWTATHRALAAPALAVAGAIILLAAAARWRWRLPHSAPRLRVAAGGCASSDYALWSGDIIHAFVAPMVVRAAAAGARLLVLPEGTLNGSSDQEVAALGARVSALAQEHGLAIAIGAILPERQENRLMLFDEQGWGVASYAKHHLVPFIESWRPGSGAPIPRQLLGTAVGGMICQDDNFTDVSRANGRLGVAVMAVPTADWAEVRHVHLQNSIHRAIEARFGVVRGASNGVSAIIAPGGTVLARRDHCLGGMGLVVADLPLAPARSLHSRMGELPALAVAGLLVLAGLLAG